VVNRRLLVICGSHHLTEPRRLAVVREYGELVEALRRRCAELEIPFEVADEVAGLPDRYVSKLLSPTPIRSLGRISWNVLAALGLQIIVVEDPDALEKAQRHPAWRERKYRKPAA
jgi:hypothetical protein